MVTHEILDAARDYAGQPATTYPGLRRFIEIKLEDAARAAIAKRAAAALDWSQVEPAIFGTLFERGLDPGKRSQLGAHHTSREDILLIVGPVVVAPLVQRWQAVKAKATVGEQRMIIEHVTVEAGGQAVVGNVVTGGPKNEGGSKNGG